jgi:branched-subunit amino acid transport protein
MSLAVLAVLMGAVTYPSRALPLLAPGIERLPRIVLAYLRLVGPATLSALAATGALLATTPDGPQLRPGLEAVAVASCVALVAWRRNLFIGIAAAVAIVALGRMLTA